MTTVLAFPRKGKKNKLAGRKGDYLAEQIKMGNVYNIVILDPFPSKIPREVKVQIVARNSNAWSWTEILNEDICHQIENSG